MLQHKNRHNDGFLASKWVQLVLILEKSRVSIVPLLCPLDMPQSSLHDHQSEIKRNAFTVFVGLRYYQ